MLSKPYESTVVDHWAYAPPAVTLASSVWYTKRDHFIMHAIFAKSVAH